MRDRAGAGGGGVANDQRAGIECGAARVGVGTSERECAGAVFGEAAGVGGADCGSPCHRFPIGINQNGRAAVFDARGEVGCDPGGVYQPATAEGDVAARAKSIGMADLDRARVERGRAVVGVGGGERQGAASVFRDANARAGNRPTHIHRGSGADIDRAVGSVQVDSAETAAGIGKIRRGAGIDNDVAAKSKACCGGVSAQHRKIKCYIPEGGCSICRYSGRGRCKVCGSAGKRRGGV